MVTCAIIGCKHKAGVHIGVRFFGIPTVIKNQCAKTLSLSQRRRAEWISRINRKEITENTVARHHKVCSKHFVLGHPSSLFDSNNRDWAPSHDLGYEYLIEHRDDSARFNDAADLICENAEQPLHENPVLEDSTIIDPFESVLSKQPISEKTVVLVSESSCVPGRNPMESLTFGDNSVNAVCDPHISDDSNMISESSCVPEGNTVDFDNFKKNGIGAVCEPLTEEDSSVRTHLCCEEPNEIKLERESLLSYPLVSDNRDMVSESFCVPEENAAELVNFRKTGVDAVCEPPTVENSSVQTDLCSEELDVIKLERESFQESVCLKARLSERAHEVKSSNKSPVKKNFNLAEAHLKINALEERVKELESANLFSQKIQKELESSISKFAFTEDSLKGDDKKITFYTGLPSFTILILVFNLVSRKVEDSTAYALPKFQQFLIVLMWLRLGLEEQDLAYRFGVSQSAISRILHRWLIPMSSSLEKLIVWPDRETLLTSMPFCFQENFGKAVAVVVNFFEVFIDRAKSFLTRSGTSSQYKDYDTLKFLIGITPQGTVSFLSKTWVGHKSFSHITEHCGILDKLIPGDILLSDRGFIMADAVGIVGAKLAYTEGKPQLSFDDVELTKKIANVQTNVARVIGHISGKYKILSSTQLAQFLTNQPGDDPAPLYHVVRVCCALTNLCPPVVPLE